ncbi:hypothetical protein [Aquimarina sediminis]|uniref:hypothetical protein n=1 Tax=Aquimarina sediminis TaxID=2070536 RepID=UPI000CA02466|nr:hypothetical protein [Aquimarina sediminis]
MLKKLLNLSNVQPLKKVEQSSINGGSGNCFLDCRQEYISCLGSGGSNCLADYVLCKSTC